MKETKGKSIKKKVLREKKILFGLVIQRKQLDGNVQVSIDWLRIASVLFVLIIAAWLSVASAMYAHLKYNKDFDTVSFVDTLLLRTKKIRKQAGDRHIKKAIEEFEAANYRDAWHLLRVGVARSPGNLEGRRMLAEFYESGMKRPAVAIEYMLDGFDYGGIENLDYMKYLLRLLLRNQKDDKVQEIADKYLPEEPENNEINNLLAFGAANANYLRGNYDRADDYLISYNLINSPEGIQLSSQISWDRGNKIAAITKLEQSLNRFPNAEAILIQLSFYYREMGEVDKARRYAILRNVKDPLSPAPRLELMYIYNKSGDTEREERETQRMFEQFSDDETAMLEFGNFAAKTGNVELARRIYELAIENEFNIGAFSILLIESHIVGKDYDGCLVFCEELIKEQPKWLTDQWAIFNGYRSVAAYAANRPDLGEIYLQHFLEETTNTPQLYLNVAGHFSTVERNQQARKVIETAYRQNPVNQKILTELTRIEIKLGNTDNLSQLITRLLTMRRPDKELLVDAYRKLGSDRFIFAQNRESLLLQISAFLRENDQSLSSATL